ncbi:MAG: CRISPR-associated protein, Csm4 family [Thermotoga sp. 50_1627]|uniref:type III-A CRISPR-associated RAMP protein Csm4 n=1 Tax=Pseudothermotoga sp. TaxID=2033661 RepID=UPI00076D5740|nr:MAG: CRISPR-associated protein, Csm4 family [Thermotoga sp. 50_64]KUK25290.1 MAG: CRISPR-associated protein, Csm4 family [Thermotoga sp. 50_1627]MBC7116973.1 type III-A CRISPR-associated RAMP protein Csm4 [Pseudothermotoga sp.]MDK2923003.1 CRISPR-associated protein Csm4 [Pseudothermotoga sp.]HBT39926.1 type III-A CRISPR-associated RAMP protein Csm4 [Pseudothermotoga sp.]
MTYRIELTFKAPLHVGLMDTAYEFSDSVIHSDTIFSALMCSHALLYGTDRTSELLRALVNGETRLSLSSAFPKVGSVRFFPKPRGETFGLDKDIFKKELKKVKFVDEDVLFKKVQPDAAEICGQFLTPKCDILEETPFCVMERPRVTVNRYDSSSNLFYFAEVHFREDAGLWFYLSVNEDIKGEIFAALKLLSDEGFGGDRTYGFGSFDYSTEPVSVSTSGNRHLLISLCVPESKEIEKVSQSVLSYELVYRTGYVFMSDRRSKKVLAFAEGSVFKEVVEGSVMDVSPEGFEEEYGYRVFRYLRAFLVPYEGW